MSAGKIQNGNDLAQASFGQKGFAIVTSGTFVPPGELKAVTIYPLPSCTVVATVAVADSSLSSHLSSDGTSGGTAVTLTSPFYGNFSQVVVSGGTAVIFVG